MFRLISRLTVILLIVLVSVPTTAVVAAKKKKKVPPTGTPVLWRAVNIPSRDVANGPGGPRPDLRRVTFIKEERGGYSKKYRVRDSEGREWVAKIGKEAQSETSAVRLLWALGYPTEINYLEPNVEIVGKGYFRNVRFEARPKSIERLDEWEWSNNPFVGTRELQGLKVMMVLLNNWDIKDSNNKVLLAQSDRGNELRYVISDLGATFGKASGWGFLWRINRSRNKPSDYAKSKFIDKVKGNRVDFHYVGKRSGLFNDITVDQARWVGELLAQLSDQQIRDAFIAANYSPSDVNLLTSEVRSRTNELLRLRAERRDMARGR
jgi:hypothetical protein